MQKAYRNQDFLDSPDARLIRLLAEYLEPERRFRLNKVKDFIVFFGSARSVPPGEGDTQGMSPEAKIYRDKLSKYYDSGKIVAIEADLN